MAIAKKHSSATAIPVQSTTCRPGIIYSYVSRWVAINDGATSHIKKSAR
jgi:hypothetical protein